MEKQNVNIEVAEGVKTLEILTGSALPRKEPNQIKINGQIDSVFNYLEKRPDLNIKNCRVEAIADDGQIVLYIDEKDPYCGVVTGKIDFSGKLKAWMLTTGECKFESPMDLALFIRKRTHHFEVKGDAMQLVTQLRNFKAKVDREIEARDDFKGNKKALLEQTVESNLPDKFVIFIPIFKGDQAIRIELEILVDADSFACTLFSTNLLELIDKGYTEKVSEQLQKITELNEELVIINK